METTTKKTIKRDSIINKIVIDREGNEFIVKGYVRTITDRIYGICLGSKNKTGIEKIVSITALVEYVVQQSMKQETKFNIF